VLGDGVIVVVKHEERRGVTILTKNVAKSREICPCMEKCLIKYGWPLAFDRRSKIWQLELGASVAAFHEIKQIGSPFKAS